MTDQNHQSFLKSLKERQANRSLEEDAMSQTGSDFLKAPSSVASTTFSARFRRMEERWDTTAENYRIAMQLNNREASVQSREGPKNVAKKDSPRSVTTHHFSTMQPGSSNESDEPPLSSAKEHGSTWPIDDSVETGSFIGFGPMAGPVSDDFLVAPARSTLSNLDHFQYAQILSAISPISNSDNYATQHGVPIATEESSTELEATNEGEDAAETNHQTDLVPKAEQSNTDLQPNMVGVANEEEQSEPNSETPSRLQDPIGPFPLEESDSYHEPEKPSVEDDLIQTSGDKEEQSVHENESSSTPDSSHEETNTNETDVLPHEKPSCFSPTRHETITLEIDEPSEKPAEGNRVKRLAQAFEARRLVKETEANRVRQLAKAYERRKSSKLQIQSMNVKKMASTLEARKSSSDNFNPVTKVNCATDEPSAEKPCDAVVALHSDSRPCESFQEQIEQLDDFASVTSEVCESPKEQIGHAEAGAQETISVPIEQASEEQIEQREEVASDTSEACEPLVEQLDQTVDATLIASEIYETMNLRMEQAEEVASSVSVAREQSTEQNKQQEEVSSSLSEACDPSVEQLDQVEDATSIASEAWQTSKKRIVRATDAVYASNSGNQTNDAIGACETKFEHTQDSIAADDLKYSNEAGHDNARAGTFGACESNDRDYQHHRMAKSFMYCESTGKALYSFHEVDQGSERSRIEAKGAQSLANTSEAKSALPMPEAGKVDLEAESMRPPNVQFPLACDNVLHEPAKEDHSPCPQFLPGMDWPENDFLTGDEGAIEMNSREEAHQETTCLDEDETSKDENGHPSVVFSSTSANRFSFYTPSTQPVWMMKKQDSPTSIHMNSQQQLHNPFKIRCSKEETSSIDPTSTPDQSRSIDITMDESRSIDLSNVDHGTQNLESPQNSNFADARYTGIELSTDSHSCSADSTHSQSYANSNVDNMTATYTADDEMGSKLHGEGDSLVDNDNSTILEGSIIDEEQEENPQKGIDWFPFRCLCLSQKYEDACVE